MLIDSKFTKKFTSNDLTDEKYKEIYDLANVIRDHKNVVSLDVANNLLFYMEMSDTKFLNYMNNKYNDLDITSNFINMYIDVYVAYVNKFKQITKKIQFKKIKLEEIEYYKRKTGDYKVGDFKNFNYVRSSNDLTMVLSFLSRYGSDSTIDYIKSQLLLTDLPKTKRKLYENTIHYANKFTLERLLKLAFLKRQNVLNKYNKPVEFKSLTFRGRSRKKYILNYNKNKKSIMKAFISLSWLDRGEAMDIPVKYSKYHYGDISNYHKAVNCYEYVITFIDDKRICVNIAVDGQRNIPENKGDIDKFIGIDVNVKHNLFMLSDDHKPFDYDHKKLGKICGELKRIDELKSLNKDYVVGKKREKKLNSLRNTLKHSTEEVIVDVCKYFLEKGYNHAIFEDLDNSFSKGYGRMNDINFNRVVKELHLSSLKDMFERIARKYDIAYSSIHAEYTSKMCSKCGCIDDNNRKSQEIFDCVECDHVDNADANASDNIKNRVSLTVLRNLLNQNAETKTFSPKPIKRDKLKKLLVEAFPHKLDESKSSFDLDSE